MPQPLVNWPPFVPYQTTMSPSLFRLSSLSVLFPTLPLQVTTQTVNWCNVSLQDIYNYPCPSFHHQWQSPSPKSQLCFGSKYTCTLCYSLPYQSLRYFVSFILFCTSYSLISFIFSPALESFSRKLPTSLSVHLPISFKIFFCQMQANCLIKQLSVSIVYLLYIQKSTNLV